MYPTHAMRSPKQIAASRANGTKSRRPVTPEGQPNSSPNSTGHGIFAGTLVLETEHPAQFHELHNELLDEHQPVTPTQTMVLETIVAARWRQRRIWGIQKMNFDYDIASITTNPENPPTRAALALRTNDESIRSHELLLRFEIALDRQISRAILRLQQLQDKKANRDSNRNSLPNREPVPSEAAPLDPPDAIDPAPQSKKNDFAKRTHQPVENTTEAAPLDPPDVADPAPQSKKNDFAKRTHQPVENTTEAAPLDPPDAADPTQQSKKKYFAKRKGMTGAAANPGNENKGQREME